MNRPAILSILALVPFAMPGCSESSPPADTTATSHDDHDHAGDDHDHDHAGEDHDHDDHDHDHDDHMHDEAVDLGTVEIDSMTVHCRQFHGAVAPGKELHLELEFASDAADLVVRAWIGTDDRLSSIVGRGEYDAEKGVHDVHAVAPDPLPENAAWWIEIERPDGTRSVRSIDLH